MRKHHKLFGMFAGALAAAMLAMPATAFAATTINYDDFELGVYTITAPGEYVLGDNVTGTIQAGCDFSLDLNDQVLSGAEDADTAAIVVSGSATAIISNGTIDATKSCVQVGDSARVKLSGVTATSNGTDATLCALSGSTLQVESGNYLNTGSSYVLECSDKASATISGGIFTATGGSSSVELEDNSMLNVTAGTFSKDLDKGDSATLSISGGAFPSLNNLSSAASDTYVLKEKEAPIYVYTQDFDSIRNAKTNYLVQTADGQSVYFEDETEAYTYYNTISSEGGHIYSSHVTVTFDAYGGTFDGKDSVSRTVMCGESISDVDAPTKEDGVFAGWTDKWGYSVDPSTTEFMGDATLYASWKTAVASIGDVNYASLYSAVKAAKDGDTVKLLTNTKENINIATPKSITVDLNGKTLTGFAEDSNTFSVNCRNCNVTIKNGTIVGSKQSGVYAYTPGGKVILSDLKISSWYGVTAQAGEATIENCECKGASTGLVVNGALATDPVVTVKSGSFTNGYGEDSAYVTTGGTLNVEGGSFANHISSKGALSITGGTFGDASNAGDVAEGYAMYKPSDEIQAGIYEVLESGKARLEADWGVTTSNGVTVYFDTKDDAQAYADANKDDEGESPLVYKLHITVTFMRTSEEVYTTGHVEYGESLTLPADPTYAGYNFLGWYYELEDGSYLPYEETDEFYDDVTLHALWLKKGSEGKGEDEKPTDRPEGEEDAKKLPQTGDAAGIASAVAAAGAALAGMGALRRRK